ncbi:valine--tRNA ligase [Candidatus Woesearchaeota archaeon]|nr:valine--tRNA ligase [Candidatus Woesearchaeota archaeon]
MELPNKYDPKESEPRWENFWIDNGIFKFDPDSNKPIFSVDTPPPTVSGKMHIGHAFSFSQQDFIVRYKRMKGYNIFCPFGTDDNGLATERLIEKMKGVKGTRMSRDDFKKLCLDTLKNELRPKYIEDWKRIGMSCDWDIFYTTINDHSMKISQAAFLDLMKKDRIYRKEAPAMWCPQCQTAISQVECEDVEMKSFFNDIVFKVKNDEGKEEELIIATTRPELLPACVAVFYHPTDKRYTHLKGKKAKVPLFDIEVPILEDERADPEKGTGIVMCCTFGDSTDCEWQRAHNLPIKEAITKDGKMTALAGKYEGNDMKTARKMMIEDMKDQRLLLSQEPITHAVNVHERCQTEIEFIHSKQWFIRYLDLKDSFLKRGNELNWYPKHMKNRYDNWINGLQWDWCISRQRFSGVPFPVWYDKKTGEPILPKPDQLPVDPMNDLPEGYTKDQVEPEKDVMDTWATSSLTPHLAADQFKDHPVYEKLLPMTLRPQAHDIITFWLFNTVVRSHIHRNELPWKDVMISGWALDPKGKKMSKSKGNVVEPQAMIEKYSSDALRFWAASSSLGEDLPFQEKELLTGQKMVTKLWNASKFTIMHLEGYQHEEFEEFEAMDRWLLSKLQKLIKSVTESVERYEYSRIKLDVEKFFWQNFCDNYLEICKDRIYNPDRRGSAEKLSAQYTLYTTLLSILKMFAPITPFITEEIYQMYFKDKENLQSIHISSWPEYDEKLVDEKAESAGDLLVNVLADVRRAKSEAKVSLKEPVKELTIEGKISNDEFSLIEQDLKASTHAETIFYKVLDKESEAEYLCDIKL